MSINFCPNRERMLAEVETYVQNNSLEVLKSFCACCAYVVFLESTLVSECMKCRIHQGITKIANAKKWTAIPDLEFLGVC
jgi:hypothetical protein